MKKIALYVDDDNRLLLFGYKDIDDNKSIISLKGPECFKYLRKLSRSKIADIYENPNDKDIVLEYDKFIIEINDYKKIFIKKGMAPILDNARLYFEIKETSKHKYKKVQRKNKYTKARVVATGLSLLVLSGCVLGFMHKSDKVSNEELILSTNDELEDDFVTTMDLDIDNDISISDTLYKPINNYTGVDLTEKDSHVPAVSIDYENRCDTDKAYKTKAYYGELIEKYAETYGIDVAMATAVATQERGIHSGIMDEGGATGLMQVQNSVWRGEMLSAYNFKTKRVETITVDEDSLSNVEYNIKVGCMILQNNMRSMEYNTLAAIQCYNMGYGNMEKILTTYSKSCGKSMIEILNDPTDIGWMNYRDIITVGDQQYIENVLSWIGNDINFENLKKDGSKVCFKINCLEQIKTMH